MNNAWNDACDDSMRLLSKFREKLLIQLNKSQFYFNKKTNN